MARLAQAHEPANHFAWALWRDAVAARGATAAAEAIGWETIRRFPENPQWRTQMATLLADQRGRPDEAVALLQETCALFPLNVATRPQLAQLLADRFDRVEEARVVLQEALDLLPDHPHTYGDLAALLADRLQDRAGAAALLRLKLQRIGPDQLTGDMLNRLSKGGRLRRAAPVASTESADSLADEHLNLPAAGLPHRRSAS